MQWSQQSVQLEPKAEFYDTLGHLLYALEFFHEAEETELTAFRLGSANEEQAIRFKKVLEKIRTKSL